MVLLRYLLSISNLAFIDSPPTGLTALLSPQMPSAMYWWWTPGRLGLFLAYTSVRSDSHISTRENGLCWKTHETRGSVGAKLTHTWQLSCISNSLLLKGQEELDIQKEGALLPVKLCLLLEGFDTKNGLLEALLRVWNGYCVHSSPWTPCQQNRRPHVFQQKSAQADEGPVGSDVCKPRQWETCQLCGCLLIPEHFGQCFPALPERRSGWGSPQVISMRDLALSQLFPLHSVFYCLLSQLWVRTLNCICTPELYITAFFPEWCSVARVYGLRSGCYSLLEKVSSFFQHCHQQSIVFKLQSWGTLADSAFNCSHFMTRACFTRTAMYRLHLSWEEQHAVPLQSSDGMTRVRLFWDRSCRSGIQATPSEVWGSSVCCVHLRALCSVDRSQLTLSELMQTHSHAERTESWLLCKSSKLMLSTDNCSSAARGRHRAQYKFTCAWTMLNRCTQRHSAQVTETSERANYRSRYTVWPSFKSSAIHAHKGKRKSQRNYYFFPDLTLKTFFPDFSSTWQFDTS